jgi:hypothetical protein
LRKNVSYRQGITRRNNNIERVYQLTLESPQVNITFSAGGLASSLSLDPTVRIDTWSRWAAVFKQFTVTKVRVASQLNRLGTAQGQVMIRVEEDSAAPSSSIVRAERNALNLVNYQVVDQDSCTTIWEPASAEDLTWCSTGTAFNIAYLKSYADATNTGTAAADSSTVVQHVVIFDIAFRYLA